MSPALSTCGNGRGTLASPSPWSSSAASCADASGDGSGRVGGETPHVAAPRPAPLAEPSSSEVDEAVEASSVLHSLCICTRSCAAAANSSPLPWPILPELTSLSMVLAQLLASDISPAGGAFVGVDTAFDAAAAAEAAEMDDDAPAAAAVAHGLEPRSGERGDGSGAAPDGDDETRGVEQLEGDPPLPPRSPSGGDPGGSPIGSWRTVGLRTRPGCAGRAGESTGKPGLGS